MSEPADEPQELLVGHDQRRVQHVAHTDQRQESHRNFAQSQAVGRSQQFTSQPEVLGAAGQDYTDGGSISAGHGLTIRTHGGFTSVTLSGSNDERHFSLSVRFPPPASPPSFGQGYSSEAGVAQLPVDIRPASLGSTDEERSPGGYEADFVAQLEDKHKCPICLQALREPVQTNCGHRFCRWCLEPVIRQRHARCPLDKEPLQKIFPDNYCKREVLTLSVKCNNLTAGCSWIGQLRELKLHLESCSFTTVECTFWDRGCRLRLLRANLQQHVEFECEYRDSLCSHCRTIIPFKDLEEHERDMCPEAILPCVNRCGAMVQRQEMPDHIMRVCMATISECTFSAIGCHFQGNRIQQKEHVEVSSDHHLSLAVEKSSSLEQQIKKLNDKVQEGARAADGLRDQLDRFERRYGEMTTRMLAMEPMSERYSQLETRLNTIEVVARGGLAAGRFTDEASGNVNSAMARRVDETVGKAEQVQADVSAAQERVRSCESNVANLERQMAHVNTLVGRTDAILAEFDLRLLSQETASFGGILIWKIPNFYRHFEEARTARKPSLYSPPFYTSRHGYKLCARVYLFGDGVGKSSHMSVFFVVMRGEFDALLAWPFHQKVTLTLLDQSPAKRHISDTFMPDPSSSSFQRPSSEMNIASGCPRFVSIDTLRTANGYVKDDTVFLKVSVDCSALPSY